MEREHAYAALLVTESSEERNPAASVAVDCAVEESRTALVAGVGHAEPSDGDSTPR